MLWPTTFTESTESSTSLAMDFFKSVFAAEPTSPQEKQSPEGSLRQPEDAADQGSGGGGWRTLIQAFASKSESVIQTYRRDLEEFGSGLKRETEAFRDVAARAVIDLPGSLDAGASAAQESLESVGQAIDEIGGSVWRGTAEIISQGKEAILSTEGEGSGSDQYPSDQGPQNGTPPSRRYSRFDAQVLAIQSDVNTFLEEPDDAQDFDDWRSGFDLAEKEGEIEKLCYENWTLEGFLEKLVPRTVSYETFWCRYYYRVFKLQQAEDARAKLVKRVISAEKEEELSWEVDDDDDGQNDEGEKDEKEENLTVDKAKKVVEDEKNEIERMDQKYHAENEAIEDEKQTVVSQLPNLDASLERKDKGVSSDSGKSDGTKKAMQKEDTKFEPFVEEKLVEVSEAKNLEGPSAKFDQDVTPSARKAQTADFSDEGMTSKSDDRTEQEGKEEGTGANMHSKSSSMQDEDDLEWDEIEEFAEHNEKKPDATSTSPLREDLRKRLSVVDDDDEDLSWDIEDDDESTKR